MASAQKFDRRVFKKVKKVIVIEELDPFWKKTSGPWVQTERREESILHVRGIQPAHRRERDIGEKVQEPQACV